MAYSQNSSDYVSNMANPGSYCYFYGIENDNITTSNHGNCLENFVSPYQKSEKSYYACKKYAPCNKLDCTKGKFFEEFYCHMLISSLVISNLNNYLENILSKFFYGWDQKDFVE